MTSMTGCFADTSQHDYLFLILFLDAEDLNETLQVSHEDELAPLLHMFNDWQRNHPGNELLILSGDVHIGGFTDIFVKVLSCK